MEATQLPVDGDEVYSGQQRLETSQRSFELSM